MEIKIDEKEDNSWNIWSKYVVSEITHLNDNCVELRGEIERIKQERKDDREPLLKTIKDLSDKIVEVGKDVEWLSKFFWIVITALSITMITTILNRISLNTLVR